MQRYTTRRGQTILYIALLTICIAAMCLLRLRPAYATTQSNILRAGIVLNSGVVTMQGDSLCGKAITILNDYCRIKGMQLKNTLIFSKEEGINKLATGEIDVAVGIDFSQGPFILSEPFQTKSFAVATKNSSKGILSSNLKEDTIRVASECPAEEKLRDAAKRSGIHVETYSAGNEKMLCDAITAGEIKYGFVDRTALTGYPELQHLFPLRITLLIRFAARNSDKDSLMIAALNDLIIKREMPSIRKATPPMTESPS